MLQTNYKLLLLMFIGKTTASIMNDDGEECGSPVESICGHGSYCQAGQICWCEAGFSYVTTLPPQGARSAIKFCLETCSLSGNTCPIGTTCKEIVNSNGVGANNYRCDCNVEGYMLSLLGQCINTVTKQTKTTGTLTTDTLTTNEPTKTTDTETTVVTTSSLNETMSMYTDKMDSLTLYIGLGVGIASFILIVIILVILFVVIRRRKRSRRSPSAVPGESGTVINNNLNTTTHNARGEGPNQYSESPVDMSDKSNVNSKGNPQKISTTFITRPRVTSHRSAAYEDIDTIFQTEGVDLSSRIPKKFDNSEINAKETSGLQDKHDLRDLYSNHKIPDKKGKGKIFNVETSTITDVGVCDKGSRTPVVKNTERMENKSQSNSQDTNPYQTPYDLTPFSTNQRPAKEKTFKVENNMKENPYSLAKPISGATIQNVKMEEQTTPEIENDYDELRRQVLSEKDKSVGQY